MNSTIVISWVAIGCFVAWISTHLVKERTRRAGLANLATGIFGALLGGLAAHEIVWARIPFNAFLLCSMGAFFASVLCVGLTRVIFPWRVNSKVS
jgi:uncharacterized membrane protein YeaQ/YmgE (transglycosylase-associated protein family)